MVKRTNETLGQLVVDIAMLSAEQYLKRNELVANDQALAECVIAWCKIVTSEAMQNARDAIECGMEGVARRGFHLAFVQAGIQAAKEAGWPIGTAKCCGERLSECSCLGGAQ